MALAAGSRLGQYEILAPLGAGGMGQVYRARDTELGRDVAIKILPDLYAEDADRIARFQREAQIVASLNHPHIAQIYGVERAGDARALVLELVEGPTLAERIAAQGSGLKAHGLPLDEALPIARQIAEALEAAHEKGITHRDLKPANVKLTADGKVKVLDFGLAKLHDPHASHVSNGPNGLTQSPTMLSPATMTHPGVILGTAAYMSPEQARGKPLDRRADIWAFGCVLFEMLSGRRPFDTGETVSDAVAAVLRADPDWQALPKNTPPHVRRLIQRCLEKDPEARVGHMSVARYEIDRPAEVVAASVDPRASSSRWRGLGLAVGAALAGALATAAAAWFVSPETPAPAPVARFLVSVAPADRLQAAPADRDTGEGRPSRTAMTWSPDGRSIVFSAAEGDRQQLYIRAVDQLEATPLPGTEGGSMPFTSPDGRWVGFWSSGSLKKVPIDGSGPATMICATTLPYGASWGADDTIVFSRGPDGLWRVPAAGGTAQVVIKPDGTKGELKFLLPQMLPGDGAILFTVIHTPLPTWEDDTEVVVQVLATAERKVLARGGADGRYLPSGHLLYLRKSTLMAVPFDLQQLTATGGAVALIADVMQSANTPNESSESGAGQFSVSATGSLLYASGGIFPDPERSLAWVDRNGSTEPLSLSSRPYLSPRISPDGSRFLVWTQGDRNVWVHELSRGVTTRLTFEGRNARAIWTPDGTRITYASATAGPENLFWRLSDGGGTADRLASSELAQSPGVWAPDGKTLLFIQDPANRSDSDIWTLSLEGDRRPHLFLQTPFDEQYPDFSPDGRWLAYVSNQSGRAEVYVQPYPGPGARQQISVDGGTAPAWSRDGRELFYVTAASVGGQAALTKMMAVPVQLKPTFAAGSPRMLFQGRYGATANIRGYDVAPDGRRFLMVQQEDRPPMRLADMIIVQNWTEELKRLVPTR